MLHKFKRLVNSSRHNYMYKTDNEAQILMFIKKISKNEKNVAIYSFRNGWLHVSILPVRENV